MSIGKFKYFGAYIVPLLCLLTFYSTGWIAWIGIAVIYGVIPLLEVILEPDRANLSTSEKELIKEDAFYDWVIFLLVPVHLALIYVFLTTISEPDLVLSDQIARVLMMGLLLGFLGINLGHDLGHKTQDWLKQFLAQLMLTTAVQNHFVPYHNGGHHRDVGTPADLTSARKGESFYPFALKSQIGGYFKTWSLEAKRLRAQGKSTWYNPMILYTALPLMLLMGIYFFFGGFVLLCYFLAAVFGISLLEAQNYFAHYGLRRAKRPDGTYERVSPKHSWNSDHLIGRVLLFELTRHSDHHHSGSKAYQVLDSKEESPMLPFGYPAMLLLSYLPFLFKPIMNRQLKKYA